MSISENQPPEAELADTDRGATRDAHVARFYLPEALAERQQLTLGREASHHLLTVMRAREGDAVELFNGDGHRYRAEVLSADRKQREARLHILSQHPADSESPLDVTIVQAISRGDRMDNCLRQATELGARALQPLYSELSIRALDDKRARRKHEHWQAIVRSAAEQSGRACLPAVGEAMAFNHWLTQWQASRQPLPTLMLIPGASSTLIAAARQLRQAHPHSRVALQLLIGPESGFSSSEIRQALDAGVQGVSLGPRVLRTETAAPAALAALQSCIGDFG